jgi:hypothetical protein
MAKQLGYMDSTDMPNIASAIRSKNSAAPDNMKISEMPTYILAIDTKPEASAPVNETIVPGGSATIPAGYYENAGSVSASLATTTDQIDTSIKETKSATGSLTSDTTVAATSGKVMTSVTVSKPDMSSATATADDIIDGKTAYGSDGTLITGTATSGTDTTDATATAADIVSGKTAYGSEGKITGTLESLDCYSDTATPSANFGNEGEIWIQVSKVYKKTTSGWTEMSADAFGTMADGKKFNKLAAPVSAIGDVTASTNAINITDDTLASGEYTLYYEDASGNKLTNWGEIGTITKS